MATEKCFLNLRIPFLLILARGLTQCAKCCTCLSVSFPTRLTSASLFCSPFPLSTSICFALPSHSAHLSVLLSLPTQHISLFCSPFPLSTSLCFTLPSHSTHLSVLLSLPTQHISLFCSTFPLNTLHSTVPQPTALSLLSRSVYSIQPFRTACHFLRTATCLSVVTVSAVPLYPNFTRSWTWATVRATCDCTVSKKIYKYLQNTTDLLYYTTSWLHDSTP